MGKPHVALLLINCNRSMEYSDKRWAVILFSGGLRSLTGWSIALLFNPQASSLQYLVFASAGRRRNGTVSKSWRNALCDFRINGGFGIVAADCGAGLAWLSTGFDDVKPVGLGVATDGLVLLVSVASSYYSYPYDEILVLPALMAAYANGNRRVFLRVHSSLVNIGFALLHLSDLAGKFGFGYMFLWWTASGWLITYVATL